VEGVTSDPALQQAAKRKAAKQQARGKQPAPAVARGKQQAKRKRAAE